MHSVRAPTRSRRLRNTGAPIGEEREHNASRLGTSEIHYSTDIRVFVFLRDTRLKPKSITFTKIRKAGWCSQTKSRQPEAPFYANSIYRGFVKLKSNRCRRAAVRGRPASWKPHPDRSKRDKPCGSAECYDDAWDGRPPLKSSSSSRCMPSASVACPKAPDWLYEIKLDGYRCLAAKDASRREPVVAQSQCSHVSVPRNCQSM